jgi:apolipoprotein N-acyltransferase
MTVPSGADRVRTPAFVGHIPTIAERRPRLAALALGAVAALGFPPLHLWPFALLAMGGLIWLVARSGNWRRAALVGWLFGVAHFTLTNNWIAHAFTYQDAMPALLGWIAVPLLACYLAVYPALAAGLAVRLASKAPPIAFAVAFGAAWIVTEWLRAVVFTGYAWAPFSLAVLGPHDRAGLAASLPFTGTYALSGLAVFAGAALVLLILRRRWRGATALLAVLVAGMYLPSPEPLPGTREITLVQPYMPQEELDDPSKYEEHFARLARLSRRDTARPGERLVLWPESAIPDYLRPGYPQRYYDQMTVRGDPEYARWRIGQAIGPDSVLLAGAVDLEIDGQGPYARATGAYNSVTAIDPGGRLVESYAKAHLVPYGEYLALRWLLEPLGATRLVPGALDFIAGPGPRTLDLDAFGRPGIQICYEIIFSGKVVDAKTRPDFIFNPSNDGWFGAWGPPQHLAQARMRAIEEGLPVLRATTTGISAIIDARGVVRASIGRNVAGRIDTRLPPALPPTPFASLNHWLTVLWVVVLAALAAVVMRRSRG